MEEKKKELQAARDEAMELKGKLDKATQTNERLELSSVRDVTEFKKSDDFKELVDTLVGEGIEKVGKSIMAFVNSQVSGVDWSQNLHCSLMLSDDEGGVAGDKYQIEDEELEPIG